MGLDGDDQKRLPFKRMTLAEYPDVSLFGARLSDIVARHGQNGRLDHTSSGGNRIVCDDTGHLPSIKQTRIYFGGKNSTILLGRLTGIARLDIACVDGSEVRIDHTYIVRGATIMASRNAEVSIGSDCMLSREIMIYASGAHGLYSATDGRRRGSASIRVGNRVWLGQGARILGGAQVGDGTVIGSYSVLAGKIPNNCAAAGNPCRVTTRDIFWTGETVQGNYFQHLERKSAPRPAFVKLTDTSDP